jgi:CRP/FNR family transcriptional regulator
MQQEPSELRKVYASTFESSLLQEIEEKSMIYGATAGQGLIKMNQTITVVPLMLSGILKVSRENDEGQEMVLYYVKPGQGCAMTLSCGMMSQPSQVKGTAEEDLQMLCVPVPVMEEWMLKYPSWKKFVMGTIVNEYIEIIHSINDVTFKKMDERLVKLLKAKTNLTGSSLINLSHQQIADELGTNRVVISRLLKRMENEKQLLLFRNQIKLLTEL